MSDGNARVFRGGLIGGWSLIENNGRAESTRTGNHTGDFCVVIGVASLDGSVVIDDDDISRLEGGLGSIEVLGTVSVGKDYVGKDYIAANLNIPADGDVSDEISREAGASVTFALDGDTVEGFAADADSVERCISRGAAAIDAGSGVGGGHAHHTLIAAGAKDADRL